MRHHLLFLIVFCLLASACRREADTPDTPPESPAVASTPSAMLSDITDDGTRTLAPGDQPLAIENIRGRIVVTGVRDTVVTVRVEGDADDITQALLAALSAEWVSRDDAYVLRPQTDTTSTETELHVRMPYETPLRIETTSGQVDIKAMAAPVEIELDEGPINIEGAAGDLDVQTGDGDIDVDMAGFPEKTNVRLRTDAGDIALKLPAQVSAEVSIDLIDGELDLGDIELEEVRESPTETGQFLSGILSDGDGSIRLRTRSGNITVRQ